MSSARAQANQKLYLAKIQLAAWQRALAAREVAAATLTQAFLPAVRQHLLGAYGWFLLAVSGQEQLPGEPPRCCAELPAIAAGMAVPGEIREFEQLETSGWLAALLAEPDEAVQQARTRDNLASAAPVLPAVEDAGQWIDQLEAVFQRMSDSLDEC